MKGVLYTEHFLKEPEALYILLEKETEWDTRMRARYTASYGHAYNYSQMEYPYRPLPDYLQKLAEQMEPLLGFMPNNCLINLYRDGKSKMGFHSDQTDILEPDTGIAIVSLGETRVLRFRSIASPEEIHDYNLPAGSLLYMTQELQSAWQHAIPETTTEKGRMSLTFRCIRPL